MVSRSEFLPFYPHSMRACGVIRAEPSVVLTIRSFNLLITVSCVHDSKLAKYSAALAIRSFSLLMMASCAYNSKLSRPG
jgi:hypothetical protein